VQEVAALEGREHLRITFPKLDGYRVEIPDEEIELDLTDAPPFAIGPSTVPTWVALDPVVGQRELEEGDPGKYRPQEVAFALARRILDTRFTGAGDRRPWLFPRLARLCRQWIDERVEVAPDHSLGYLMTITEAQALAAEAVWNAIVRYPDSRRERLRPMINRFDAEGSTADVYFHTRKATVMADKSEVSHVTLDGADGNTWEQLLASELELSKQVHAYVKNDHLGFVIPYLYKGRTHAYWPDFLVRLQQRDGDPIVRTLIIEVSGSRKSPGSTAAKAVTARNQWCVAVNNHGGFGRWGYVELTNPLEFRPGLRQAIDALYGDDALIGDPDLLDYDQQPDLTRERLPRGA
jgi:type III restriction enzyme